MRFTNETVLENWLTKWEKEAVIEKFLSHDGILKFSNNRDLRLKNGGFTDIFLEIRNTRSYPGLTHYLSKKYINAINRLEPEVDLFGEVPEGISHIAGAIHTLAVLPEITFRKNKKANHTDIIGGYKKGQNLVIIDDVITDGQSKIMPYENSLKAGLNLLAFIVLCDRQQGWRQTFQKLGINACIWAGMTLHDIRRYLIENGLMQRCKPENEEKNPIILAPDNMNWGKTLSLVDPLRTSGCIFKVNDLVFNEGIKNLLPNLQIYGETMVDLKSLDIENTVANITKHIVPHNPWAITVHASGGEKMVKVAVKTLKGTDTKVLAVTVLTSIDSKTCEEIYVRQPWEQVKKLAEIANRAGAHGLVCSPEEVRKLRQLYPQMTLVTPGIRSEGANKGDQVRISTPAKALENGATHIVMGRQITESPDPIAEVYRVLNEELKIKLD